MTKAIVKTQGSGPLVGTAQALAGVPVIYTREKLMEVTASLIEETHDRVSGSRFKVQAGDRERIAYIRLLSDLLKTYSGLLEASGTPKTVNGLPRQTTQEDLDHEAWQKEEIHQLSTLMRGSRNR
jgi:hypothetical protein